jgi:hypothetical protein
MPFASPETKRKLDEDSINRSALSLIWEAGSKFPQMEVIF